jgi:glyceraldehyde-3-phosphate dehydrogenase (NAD(P))
MSSARVAVVGCGTIGKRVADAVVRQPDMTLAGIAIRSPSPAALAAAAGGARLYCGEPERRASLERVGLPIAGNAEQLFAEADAVVDCGPGSTGAERLHGYAAFGLRAVLCGGVPHRSVGLTFCTSGNYAAALGRTAARVTSCNTTALVRLLAALHPALREGRAHATLVRSASEPDKPRKGAAGATVTLGPSHHAADIRLVLPWARLTTLALSAPMVHGHVLTMAAQLDSPLSVSEAVALLAAARRIVVRDAPRTTDRLRDSALHRPRADQPEVLVWPDSIAVDDGVLLLTAAVHMESIVVPETIDCVRALCGLERDGSACAQLTDSALDLDEPVRAPLARPNRPRQEVFV